MTAEAIQASSGPVNFVFDENINIDERISQSLQGINPNELITGKVVDISKDFVTIDLRYKSEGLIPVQEFFNEDGGLDVQVGDDVELYLENLENNDGQIVVSKEKAKKIRVWEDVGKIYEEGGVVKGTILSRIKGGLSVDIGVKAFLPGSQVDLRPIRNLDKLIGEAYEFKVLKYNQKRGNIVLSRRALLEVDREERRKKTLELIHEGAIINGHVKNITDYGIFVDLGGVDGLLHITDMTWGRIVHPSEMYNIGDEIEVVILKFDEEEEKVSLGLKQKSANPWDSVASKYPVGTHVSGKIVSITNYGAFVELEEGVEGLIHVSEMSWGKKVTTPGSFVNMGDEVSAIIKDVDIERKRISLSIKELQPNPWKEIADQFPVGTLTKGTIRNITDFGLFVGLDEGIDGLVHVSDISWSQRQKNPTEVFQKNQEIEVKVLSINIDKERLSLGIKQLTEDPWSTIESDIHLNEIVKGKVVHIADFGVFIEISEGVEGLIHLSEIEDEGKKKNLSKYFPLDGEVEARVINIDTEERRLGLSLLDENVSPAKPAEESSTKEEPIITD